MARSRRSRSLKLVLAERIRALREARGIPRTQLAARSGVALTTLSLVEAARVHPTTATLEKIAATLSCRVRDLLDDEPTVVPPLVSRTYQRLAAKLQQLDEREQRAVERLIRAFLDSLAEAKG